MKKNFLLLLVLLAGFTSFAQREGISYQAVIINPDAQQLPGFDAPGTVLGETEVQLRFSILDETNNVEYQEEIDTMTDAYGMVNVLIGTGQAVDSNGFDTIKWDGQYKSLYVELNLKRGGGYTFLGIQGLSYVPYAQHRDVNASGDLTVDGTTTLNGDFVIEGQTIFNSDIDVAGDLTVGDDLEVADRLTVLGRTELQDQVTIDGDAILNRDLTVTNGNTNLDGPLEVNGPTELGGTLQVSGFSAFEQDVIVQGQQTIGGNQIIAGGQTVLNNVQVGGQVEINQRLIVDGDSILNNDLTLTNGNTSLGGLLDVQSDTTIGGGLAVNDGADIGDGLVVGGDSDLNGTLNVALKGTMESALEVIGPTTLNNSLKVEGGSPAQFSGDVLVLGTSNFEGPLNVLNSALTDLSGSLHVVKDAAFDDDVVIDGMLTVNNNLNLSNLQVTGAGNLAGEHIALFENSSGLGADGIAIRINQGNLNSNNQFVTFLGDGTHVAGRISSFDVNEDLPSNMPEGWNSSDMNQGVVYGSRGADYAEWLEKEDPKLDFTIGEVVGVHAGKISRVTKGADHILTISMAPIVLGNMPDADRKDDFEKVGFMGQVPALVSGPVALGDYILASGNNDGLAVAVSPNDLELDQMERIIGKAWSASDLETPKLINVSVGLKSNEWLMIIQQQQKQMNDLDTRLKQLEKRLDRIDTN